jgi:hypothetical protein
MTDHTCDHEPPCQPIIGVLEANAWEDDFGRHIKLSDHFNDIAIVLSVGPRDTQAGIDEQARVLTMMLFDMPEIVSDVLGQIAEDLSS